MIILISYYFGYIKLFIYVYINFILEFEGVGGGGVCIDDEIFNVVVEMKVIYGIIESVVLRRLYNLNDLICEYVL